MTTDEQTMTKIDTNTAQQTGRHISLRKEVLFFATAHFLFLNFIATAQNTLSFFCRHSNPPQKKNERVFSPTFYRLRSRQISKYCFQIFLPLPRKKLVTINTKK